MLETYERHLEPKIVTLQTSRGEESRWRRKPAVLAGHMLPQTQGWGQRSFPDPELPGTRYAEDSGPHGCAPWRILYLLGRLELTCN